MAEALQAHVGLEERQPAEAELPPDDYQPIERLQEAGIAAVDIKRAREGGFHTIDSLVMHPKKRLCTLKGLSDAKVDKIIDAARKLTALGAWQAASDHQREVLKLSTGCSAVNELLGGGVETKAITEIYGEHRTGKTQLCMTMCVTTQMSSAAGGGEGKVAYIDTEGTFRAERVAQIARRFGLDTDAVLDNITYARAYTVDQQMDLLVSIAALMAEDPYKMLIIDSIIANFRTEFTGRGELAERQQKLSQTLAIIKRLSEEYNVAVVITNQMQADPGGGMTFVADPKKPVGGHILAHASTHRLYVRKGKGEQRVIKVTDSPGLPEGEASFALSNDGVVDYRD